MKMMILIIKKKRTNKLRQICRYRQTFNKNHKFPCLIINCKNKNQLSLDNLFHNSNNKTLILWVNPDQDNRYAETLVQILLFKGCSIIIKHTSEIPWSKVKFKPSTIASTSLFKHPPHHSCFFIHQQHLDCFSLHNHLSRMNHF